MIINKLDKSFGPSGSIAGVFLFISGIIIIFFSFSGLFLILFGAFWGFSTSGTIIDVENSKIKFSNNLFGFWVTGQWFDIEPDMKIGIKVLTKVWRTFSQSNRTLEITVKNFGIMLYRADNKEIMPIMKTKSLDKAKIELDRLSQLLKLDVIKYS